MPNKYNSEYAKLYLKKNPNYNKKKCHKYYIKNKETIIKKTNQYKKEHPEKVLKWTNNYIKKINKTGFSSKIFGFMRSKWSKYVLKRDGYQCQLCTNQAVVSHHILYKSLYPNLSLNKNNGIALCLNCHYETHGWNIDSGSLK